MSRVNTVSVEDLRVGVFVMLDVGWMNHPFHFNNFKIKNDEQIRVIRELGIREIRYDPLKSEVRLQATSENVLPETSPVLPMESAGGAAPEPSQLTLESMEKKRKRIEALSGYRERIHRVESTFLNAMSAIKSINRTIYSDPKKAAGDAGRLVGQMVDELLLSPEVAIHVMADKKVSEDIFLHSINVSVLSMILAKELKIPADLIRLIGVGSIFHDIGLQEIPSRIVTNTLPSKAERELREMHTTYGHDLARKAGLPQGIQNIISQHHECVDGSGYPKQLKGDQIDLLARLVAITNAYDNLCNPAGSSRGGMTPHEALSHLFSHQRHRFDGRLLQAFIRFMGVYPPGTIVALSNQMLGLVIEANSATPLRPSVIVYDPEIPKLEALILDLNAEPDISIERAIHPAKLPQPVFEYLNPRRRVNYYFKAKE